jgi:hypothetical protein
MWRSTQWTGLDTTFRNAVFAIATLILIHLPSPSSTVPTAQQQSGAPMREQPLNNETLQLPDEAVLTLRQADLHDVPSIVDLLSDDPLGQRS